MVWTSLKKFCDQHYPEQKFRNDSQRKAFVIKKGLQIQKDENGKEGVAVCKDGDSDTKEIRIGKRLSATKTKEFEYGEDHDKNDIAAQNAKNAAGLTVNVNTKD